MNRKTADQSGWYEVTVHGHFSAAHRLKGYRGKCARLHGHNWMVAVTVCGKRLQRDGMLVDFAEIKAALASVLDAMDHRDLNAVAGVASPNPTSETIARHVFKKVSAKLRNRLFRVCRVSVRESPGNEAVYCEPA